MEARLNIITLGAHDFKRAVDFYEKGLGWAKSPASQGDIAFFKLGNIVLAIYPREALAEDITIPAEGSGFGGITIAYNTRSEKEVDDTIGKVERLGATIIKRPGKVFWGGYSSYFRDPEGHIFEVAFNPYLQLDEQGNLMLP